MVRYFTVTEETLDSVSEETGTQKSYFEKELERAIIYNNHLVVFFHEGQWKQLDISRQYNVDFVMKHHFKAES